MRPREFDTDSALDGAIAVFREHGSEGSSAPDARRCDGDRRQSLRASATSGSSIAGGASLWMGECAAHFLTRFEAARVLSTDNRNAASRR
jgi:hypothetical protein